MSGRPIIGITSYAQPARWGAWELPAALVPLYYVESVERAGGRALLVPPSDEDIDDTLDVLDGTLSAESEAVLVARDRATGRSRPLTARERDALTEALPIP